jgi:hypothetical protein
MLPSLSTRPQRLSTRFTRLQQAYDPLARFLDTAMLLV